MEKWFELSGNATGDLTVTFLKHPEKRWYSPTVLQDVGLPDVAGRKVILTGAGAAWMYIHVACLAVSKGAKTIDVRVPNCSEAVTVFPLKAKSQATWCRVLENFEENEQVVEFDGRRCAPDDLASISLRDDLPLRITGLGAVWMYAAAGAQAAKLPDAIYDSPREAGLVSVGTRQPGVIIPRRNSPEETGVVIGIVGDPNSGKSVLSKGLFEALRRRVQRTWGYDCDAASPTPNWYLGVLNSPGASDDEVRRDREKYKVKWSPELEANVASQLRSLKQNLAITLADLPGGRHPKDGDPFPPERIPPTRKAMFENIDLFIILGRENKPEIVDFWRDSLEERGCGGRVIAELISCAHDAAPGLSDLVRQGLVLRGRISGLDRTQPRERIAAVLDNFGDELLKSVQWWKLAGQARGAVTRAFLTQEGGVRYGAAALCADGRTILSGQYSSFNHVTNIHAEQAVLAAAAAAGSADVVALAVASTEPGAVARPCGICRQVMLEHRARTQRDFAVIMVDHQWRLEHCEVMKVSELLPAPWHSHRTGNLREQPRRSARPELQPFEGDSRLTTGAHVVLPGSALAMVWDADFNGDALVKVKYRPLPDETWEKLPHSLTETSQYLTALREGGLATATFCGATAALAKAGEIRKWAPPRPVVASDLPPVLAACLADAGIDAARVCYTGSRALGLSEASSDHDLVVRAGPEEIQAFRRLCANAIHKGKLTIPAQSGSWRLMERVFPGGCKAILQGRRFLETLSESDSSFAMIFTPVEQDGLDAQGWQCLGWNSLSGRVEDDRRAAYKRSRFSMRATDGRRVGVVAYHKLANLVRSGDALSVGGWLMCNRNAEIPYRLYQLAAAIDNIVWMDAASC